MLRIGDLLRVPSPANTVDPVIDGYKNYYYETTVPGHSRFNFRAGINKSANITDKNGISRCPVIVIDSNPSSSGTTLNPWRDEFYPDRGTIKYYGDNKVFDKNGRVWIGKPEEQNNKFLLEQAVVCQSDSREERLNKAVPIAFFEKQSSNIALRKFQGYGIVEKVELVTQYSVKYDLYFPNYVFTFCVLSMKRDGEAFDWNWIAKRCNPDYSSADIYSLAPQEWKSWIDKGPEKLHLVRRNVSTFSVIDPDYQKPAKGSDDEKLLYKIYHYYNGRKHDFESLALEVTRKVIEESGATVTPGWVTQKSSDHGIDFVLRVDLGNDKLAGLQVVLLGQAKCEDPSGKVNGKDIARTVARLKRGWIGAFVTLQTFTENMQIEVKEDQYPLMLINGKKVVEIVKRELYESRLDLNTYLHNLTVEYKPENRLPEDILD